MSENENDEELMLALARFAGLDTALEVCPQSLRVAWEASKRSTKALEAARQSVAKDSLLRLHGETP